MQRSTEATLDWSQWRDKLGIDLYECSINTLVSLPNDHIAVAPRLRAFRNWVLPDVQLPQRPEVLNDPREADELVAPHVQLLQLCEVADGLREAVEMVCRKLQIT